MIENKTVKEKTVKLSLKNRVQCMEMIEKLERHDKRNLTKGQK